MSKTNDSKQYDLEDRTLAFARAVRSYVSKLPRTISTIEDGKQLVRSSGSIGSNYREANEAISKKDFKHCIRIARKEAKETIYWLKILNGVADELEEVRGDLEQEAKELMMILAAILHKSE